MTRSTRRLLPLLATATLAACANEIPTTVDESLVPVGPITVEVRLPWAQFASNPRVLGGYGRADEVGLGFLANGYQGTLSARTLLHFASFPTEATLPDSTGTTRTDTQLTFVGGNVMIRLESDASTNTGPVTISAGRTPIRWDAPSANWANAVDTLNHRVPWPQPGAGPAAPLGSIVWNKSEADSVLIRLDSVAVTALADTTLDKGVRLALDTPGERLQLKHVTLQLIARPSVHPDTLITLTVNPTDLTFIYTPDAPPPTTGLRVGGVPAWRSIFNVALPAAVPGPAAACARVTCPLTLTVERINYAGLVLTTRPSEPAFRPTDSLGVEARTVLAPEALPKSPLGEPLFIGPIGRIIGASLPFAAFEPGGARTIEVGVTPFIQDLLRGTTVLGHRASPTLALLSLRCPPEITSCFESQSLAYASFVGPGQTGEPYLRLLLTVSDRVQLP